MLPAFIQHIDHILPEGERLLLAVSGGVDSVLLCHLCHHSGLDFAIAHCNFQLRGEASDMDEQFVETLAERFRVPFHRVRFDTLELRKARGGSVQMVARALRYEWFLNLALRENHSYIATAHHLDDSLETAIYNLAKGTGLRGLRGIRERQSLSGGAPPYLIRPLLVFTKEEIQRTAIEWGLDYREDASNASDKYARNKIRHYVVPVLRELNPGLEKTFLKSAGIIGEEEELLDFFLRKISDDIVGEENGLPVIDKHKLKNYPARQTILFRILQAYGFHAGQVRDLVSVLDAQPGQQFFSREFRLVNDRESILVSERRQASSDDAPQWLGEVVPGGLEAKGFRFEQQVIRSGMELDAGQYLDFDMLAFPLQIRRWQPGDTFHPLGMRGRKKLKKYFTDRKYSLLEKEKTWLLVSEGEICAILGDRIDERFKLTEQTKRVLSITNPGVGILAC